jgi:hypothetical protein
MGTGALSPGVLRPMRGAGHSPVSGAEVGNAWSCAFAPPMRLCGVVLGWAVDAPLLCPT